jgi:hypothetical protein
LSNIFDSERSIGTKVSIDMAWIGDFMGFSFVQCEVSA